MKKLIASAGLAAVSATGLQAAYAPGVTPMEASKPWSIAASVRGFYDDNWNTSPKDLKQESFGYEIQPKAALNMSLTDQTFLSASYVYGMRYYENRAENKIDQSHEVDLRLNHKFSERYKIEFENSFAYSKEPEVISGAGSASSTFFRTDSEALRNRARIEGSAAITELISIAPGYSFGWYDYLDEGIGSRSALLDRFEHLFHIDGQYQIQEHLIGILGYQFQVFDYTSKEAISIGGPPGDSRDSTSHVGYVGATWAPSSQLNGTAKAGVQYTTYNELGGSQTSPYFDLNATYTYLQNSYAQLGVRHTRNPTDVGDTSNGVVKDQESTLVYLSVNHRVSREVTASLIGQYQHGEFNGGSFDGDIEHFLLFGLNLEYKLNPNWSIDAGYNWDRLDSDLPNRSFSRNRVYVGASATF